PGRVGGEGRADARATDGRRVLCGGDRLMLPILTPAQASALDRASVERGVPVLDLMERAGLAVSRAATTLAGSAYGTRAVGVCGKGNNGGGGLVAARHLDRAGMGVTVLLMSAPSSLEGAAATSFRRFDRGGGRWRVLPNDPGPARSRLQRELARAHLVIDAMF